MKDICNIAKQINLVTDDLILYGENIAKIKYNNFDHVNRKGKLILVTSINPTKAGEGKTTSAIGIADKLNNLGHQTILALREPSLGPVLGLKGSATGGGECVLLPENEINLHFTGDFHAITSANNLVSTMIDNFLYWDNPLQIDINKIVWQRCLDLNDRALREVEINIKKDLVRKEKFQITAASEIMAILSLSKNFDDLRQRLDQTIVAYNINNEPIYIKDLKITGSLLALLKDAILPNLVQTKYETPALIHCGPFANISHGTNSIIATELGLKLSDYVVCEAGFGSDLGFEKFNDIVNSHQEFTPDCTVLVVTIKALKLNGDLPEEKLDTFDLASLAKGLTHLEHHINIIRNYHLNFLVCINQFATDLPVEIEFLTDWLEKNKIEYGINNTYHLGIKDQPDLANKIIKLANQPQHYTPIIDFNHTLINEKINIICQKIYATNNIEYRPEALAKINHYNTLEFKHFSVCMAKNHQTIWGNADRHDNKVIIWDIKLNSGAQYFIIYLSKIITLPGLNKNPNAFVINVQDNTIINIK